LSQCSCMHPSASLELQLQLGSASARATLTTNLALASPSFKSLTYSVALLSCFWRVILIYSLQYSSYTHGQEPCQAPHVRRPLPLVQWFSTSDCNIACHRKVPRSIRGGEMIFSSHVFAYYIHGRCTQTLPCSSEELLFGCPASMSPLTLGILTLRTGARVFSELKRSSSDSLSLYTSTRRAIHCIAFKL
jgi:hypothetical protein